MSLQFLSLTEENIPYEKITTEIVPKITKFILEINGIRKQVMENNFMNPEMQQESIRKMKLISDIIDIYKSPTVLRMIKEFVDEKEKVDHSHESNKKRREMIERARSDDSITRMFEFFNLNSPSPDTTIQKHEQEQSDSDFDSEVSEDEYHQEEFALMIANSYENIKNHSMIGNLFNVERSHECELRTPEINEEETEEKTSVEEEGKMSVNGEKTLITEKVDGTSVSASVSAPVSAPVSVSVPEVLVPTSISIPELMTNPKTNIVQNSTTDIFQNQ